MIRILARIIVIFGLVGAAAAAQASDSPDTPGHAADVAYDALMRNFWDSSRGDFAGTGTYWFYAQSLDIATLAEQRNPAPANKDLVHLLYDRQAKRGFLQGAQVYFDDENWMALSLARAFVVDGDPDFLKTARLLFDDVLSRGTLGRSEGVWWDYEHGKVAAAANAGPVITGLLLWKLTGDARYRDFALRTYAFWLRDMVDESSGQVYDQILANGSKDKTPWSYDQGLMIGAAVELFRTTGDQAYLDQARLFSRYMIDNMKSTSGVMIEQTCVKHRKECLGWKDVAQFKGIAFRYLVELAKVDPSNQELRDYLDKTATSLMSPQVFDSKTGRFAYEWDGSEPPSTGYYQTTNSAALALAAYATLF